MCCVQPDDMERFLFFSRAALEFLVVTGRQPDVLHLHDWQSSAVVRHSQLGRLTLSRRLLCLSLGGSGASVSTAACVAAQQHAFSRARSPRERCVLARLFCVMHVSVWPVCIVCVMQAPLLAHEYRQRGLSRPRTMLTIHNIAFQVRHTIDRVKEQN